MRKLLYLFPIVFLTCNKNAPKYIGHKEAIRIDTIATTAFSQHIYGIIKKSKPFKINGIECYWEQTDTLAGGTALDLIRLKEHTTHQILASHLECCLKYGFDFDASDHFLDVNFDGYKDFLIRSYGSMAAFEVTNIYLFDPKTKRFFYSELSDNGIETDSINRKLITNSFDKGFEKIQTHYFDKAGKITYTDVLTIEYLDTIAVEYRTYEKIVNGKVLLTKKDTVHNREE